MVLLGPSNISCRHLRETIACDPQIKATVVVSSIHISHKLQMNA